MEDLKEVVDTTKTAPILKARFECSIPHCRFSFTNGKEAIFLNGEYLTDMPNEVRELSAEVDNGNPFISINKERAVVDVAFRDPMDVIRAQVRAELIAEQAAISSKAAEMGTSEQGDMVVGNTATAGAAMSGSTSIDSGGVTGTVVTAAPALTAAGAKIVAGPVSK